MSILNYEIVPTLFAIDESTFLDKLKKLEFCPKLHIDFMDGEFTAKNSVNFEVLEAILSVRDVEFEIHMMVKNPLKYLDRIIELGIKKVFLQVESLGDLNTARDIIFEFDNANISVFLVLNPRTPLTRVSLFLPQIDGVMFMGVVPGAEGQELDKSVLEKVRKLREKSSNIQIQFDGGIKEDNILELKKCGVNLFAIGSAISGEKDVKKEYSKFLGLVNE